VESPLIEAARGALDGPPGSVTVVVTVLRDPRVVRTIESLLRQSRAPDQILIDDGGGTDEVLRATAAWMSRDARVRHLAAPGTIAESRNQALRVVRTEFIAFLDADEVAPPSWLERLLTPFQDPTVGFTGGPTPAMPETLRSIGGRYYDGYLRRFYDRVARVHPHALPMGNSAWRKRVFDEVGLLDTTLFPRASSEDQDIAVRAQQAGWKGVYVPEAPVLHDFSELTTTSFLRKQARYAQGGYLVWRRRGTTYEARVGSIAPYVALPLLAILGAILLIFSTTRFVGTIALIVSGVGFLALILGLTIQGRLEESRYPGFKYRALEILRRWATLYGAFRGFWAYGWGGRRVPSAPPGDNAPGKP
jgi:cellulose synthase/poly-beta-1,6-N-acetylglucosamine synthase-like glycosyltransferase